MKQKRPAILILLAIVVVGLLIGYLLGKGNPAAPQTDGDSDVFLQITERPSPESGVPDGAPTPGAQPQSPEAPSPTPDPDDEPQPGIDEDGKYNTKDEVALYIHTFGHLPPNYVTKSTARNAGWDGGSLEKYYPGCSIGGDVFQNREGLLPKQSGRTYYECDIGTAGKNSRGEKRIVFSNDGLIYYTDDHYQSFTLLYGEA